ncbi:MAG: RNA polymerase-binding protein DksA [Gammaproteobacteria bacterium]|nr:RNA polymerase-binding protein DksA [Gammaproteobacteria bacterium]
MDQIDNPLSFVPYEPKKGEEYMSPEQIEHFRTILTHLYESVNHKMIEGKNHMKEEPENFSDPVDRASQEEELSLELRAQDRERKLIRKIQEAIEMLKEGDYGFCQSCGAEIGLRRLEARPTATQCIDCKTLDELKEKQLYS